VEAVGEFPECSSRHPAERKELTAMSMPGKLKVYARVLGNRQAIGYVVEEDAGRAAFQMEAFKKWAQLKRGSGVSVRHSDDLKAVDDDTLVVQHANAGAGEGFFVVVGSSERLVIPANEEDAKRRRLFPQWGGLAVWIDTAAVVEITGDKENCRIELLRDGGDAPGKGASIDVAEVEVTDEESCASTPGRGQIRKANCYAALTNDLRIDESVDGGQKGNEEQDLGYVRSGAEVGVPVKRNL